MYSVLIVDDHPVVRLAVRVLLEKNGMQVKGETDNGLDAIRLVRESEPDVVILDIGIPKLDGLTVISRINSLHLKSKVLVLTSQSADLISNRCMKMGARGFINKEEDLSNMLNAVKAVAAGYSFFPAVNYDADNSSAELTEPELILRLTDREIVVLQHLARGLTNKIIGEKLFLSAKTVSTYKTRILQKLGLSSVIEIADFAKRNALIE
jgi:two-component system response regulator EvgA